MSGRRRLLGKRCLVTGGARNLGRALCLAFADAGAQVAFTYHKSADKAAETERLLAERASHVSDYQPLCFQGSVTDAAHATRVIGVVCDHWGGVDVLCNSASEFQILPFALIEEGDWDRVMDVGAKGPYLFCRAALRPMLRQKSGHILNIGAFTEGRTATRLPAPYAAAKAALHGLTRALAQEVGRRGIQVNYLAPGLLDGGMGLRVPKSRVDEYVAHSAMGRVATMAELAEIATWMVSDDNSLMSGASILADGGVRA